jgi:hypothetical protein
VTTTRDATARQILRRHAEAILRHVDDPAADVLTLAAQTEQTAGLVRAEVAESTTVTTQRAEPERPARA